MHYARLRFQQSATFHLQVRWGRDRRTHAVDKKNEMNTTRCSPEPNASLTLPDSSPASHKESVALMLHVPSSPSRAWTTLTHRSINEHELPVKQTHEP